LAAAAILCVGASVTYIAWRLAHGAQAAYAGGMSIPNLRMLRVPDHQPERSPQSAIDELDAMIGLAPVKDEVNKLIARLQVEQKRHEQGLPVTPNVVVLATSVEVVPHVGVGRCDGHHGSTFRVPHYFLDGRPTRQYAQ
jgi:hypothetical protein